MLLIVSKVNHTAAAAALFARRRARSSVVTLSVCNMVGLLINNGCCHPHMTNVTDKRRNVSSVTHNRLLQIYL